MEFIIRPKDDYLKKANWEQLYILTDHWKSNVEFYKEETDFLKHLCKEKLLWQEEDKYINTLLSIDNQLLEIDLWIERLQKKIQKHLHYFCELIEFPFSHNESEFLEAHSALEDELIKFHKSYRKLKTDLFQSVSKIKIVIESKE